MPGGSAAQGPRCALCNHQLWRGGRSSRIRAEPSLVRTGFAGRRRVCGSRSRCPPLPTAAHRGLAWQWEGPLAACGPLPRRCCASEHGEVTGNGIGGNSAGSGSKGPSLADGLRTKFTCGLVNKPRESPAAGPPSWQPRNATPCWDPARAGSGLGFTQRLPPGTPGKATLASGRGARPDPHPRAGCNLGRGGEQAGGADALARPLAAPSRARPVRKSRGTAQRMQRGARGARRPRQPRLAGAAVCSTHARTGRTHAGAPARRRAAAPGGPRPHSP